MRHYCDRKSERGVMTIVEAAFVFPIMFFIVFFMIMAGEAYFQHSRVEYLVTNAAIEGAARCENPMMKTIAKKGGSVPNNPSEPDVMPYRYIFTGEAKNIGDDVEDDLRKTVRGLDALLFKGMKPDDVVVSVEPHMNPLISSFDVKCSFEVPLPIRMPFTDSNLDFSYDVEMSASIGDPAEFIRTVSIVEDVLERNANFTKFCEKVKGGMQKIGAYIG